jgi:hypothetical protein
MAQSVGQQTIDLALVILIVVVVVIPDVCLCVTLSGKPPQLEGPFNGNTYANALTTRMPT